ncbi:hypothetical protein [Lentzea albida]|uniref:hypothetical protein n=1 Tax=Lentzea albida TaxID=65499 RepID=UPI0015A69B32|nr:hypothetical protein [Lentzea albida]
MALTFSRSQPGWALVGTQFSLLNGFSPVGMSELVNGLLLGRGLCETRDLLDNSAGAVAVAALGAGCPALRQDRR